MNGAFLLGAGFSHEISPEVPLLSGLSKEVKQTKGLQLSMFEALGDDIELWLSYLSQPHPWLRESDNLKNQVMALEIAEDIGAILDRKEQAVAAMDCPTWLRQMTGIWHNNKSSVISLNYDTLV